MWRCGFCANEMGYVHGHSACLHNVCPMFGVNQGECCTGELACPVDVIPRAPTPPHGLIPARRDETGPVERRST